MAEKKCRFCAMIVPKEASFCPFCRKQLKTSFGVKLFAGLMLTGFVAAALTPAEKKSVVPKQQEINLTEKGKKVKNKHPEWDNDVCNTIAAGKIHPGMTPAHVRASWGKPYKINTTISGNHKSEQWVMSEYGGQYVYFDNGILTSIQQSR